MKWPRFLCLLLLAASLTAMGKKQPPFSIRFYAEGNPQDTGTFATQIQLLSPPKMVYIQKIPALSERDIIAAYPFDAADGSKGCGFKLDDHGTMMLDSISVEKRGTMLVAVVNGRQVVDLQIDKRISDGIVVIPNGLQPLEIEMIKKRFHMMGPAATKGTAKPTPTPNPQNPKLEY